MVVTEYVIKRKDGTYYRRGPNPQWTRVQAEATRFAFLTTADATALLELDLGFDEYHAEAVAFETPARRKSDFETYLKSPLDPRD